MNGAFLIVDSGNAAVRRIQQSPPLPAIDSPQIGYIIITTDPTTGQPTTQLVPVTQAVFNNEVVIGILAEGGVETFSYGSSPPNAFEDTVPNPSSATGLAPLYRNGGSSLPPSLISPVLPDLTVKSISSMDGRRPSPVVKARFQFKTATPDIAGDNAASFAVSNLTTGAKMYYTIDGSDPTNGPPSLGPIASGDPLSLNLGNSNLLFKVIAFKDHFLPSAVVSNLFTPSNFVANRITLRVRQRRGLEHLRRLAGTAILRAGHAQPAARSTNDVAPVCSERPRHQRSARDSARRRGLHLAPRKTRPD